MHTESKNIISLEVDTIDNNYQTISDRFVNQLKILNESGRLLTSVFDPFELYDRLHALASRLINFDAFYIAFNCEENDCFDFVFVMDEGVKYETGKKVIHCNILQQAYSKKQPILVNRTEDEYNDLVAQNKPKDFGNSEKHAKSIITAPILGKKCTSGIISAQSYQLNNYRDIDLHVLVNIANQSGFVIENSRLSNLIDTQEQQLKDLTNKVKTITHKLNQPLTGIRCYTSVIMEEIKNDDEFFEEICEIDIQADELEKLIRKMQKSIPVENGTCDKNNENVDTKNSLSG